MDDGTGSAPTSRPYNAMAFFDERDFFRPTDLARAFAGKGGRLATVPDIVAARLAAPTTDVSWERNVTTATAEYFGTSAGGVPIVVVAHGVGPLADPEGAFMAYVADRDDDRHGRIARAEFLKIADGAYGDVTIVELRDLYRLRRFPLLEMLTYDQACEDPLVRARLGADAEAFLARHREASVAWLRHKGYDVHGNDCVMSLRDTPRVGYGAMAIEDGWAYAHLIDVSPQTDYGHGHWDGPRWHRSLVTELECHDWGRRVGAVGIRGDGPIGRIHPGPEVFRAAFARTWRTLVRRADAGRGHGRFATLAPFGGVWFTRHDGSGCGAADGEPEHPVRKIERTGDPVEFRMPIAFGDHRTVAFDETLVRRESPPWANAYRVVGEARTVWEGERPSHHLVKVEYCVADVERGWRVPPMKVLERDFDAILAVDGRVP